MNKHFFGSLCVLLGSVLLSLNLYGLKLIQMIDKSAGQDWWSSPAYYLKSAPISLSFAITIGIIITGLLIIILNIPKR